MPRLTLYEPSPFAALVRACACDSQPVDTGEANGEERAIQTCAEPGPEEPLTCGKTEKGCNVTPVTIAHESTSKVIGTAASIECKRLVTADSEGHPSRKALRKKRRDTVIGRACLCKSASRDDEEVLGEDPAVQVGAVTSCASISVVSFRPCHSKSASTVGSGVDQGAERPVRKTLRKKRQGISAGQLSVCQGAQHDTEEVLGEDLAVPIHSESSGLPTLITRSKSRFDQIVTKKSVGSEVGQPGKSKSFCDAAASWEGTKTGRALQELQQKYLFLTFPWHYLHEGIEACRTALLEGDAAQADDILENLEKDVQQENDSLAVAFDIFKQSKERLAVREIQFMLQYFGFPSTKHDILDVLAAIDADGDYQLSFAEFQTYIGRMGGSLRVFGMRGSISPQATSSHDQDIKLFRHDLIEAGIDDSSQAYWRLLMPMSELKAVACLLPCQKAALRQIRLLAKNKHEMAIGQLQRRMRMLGYKDTQLWMTLAWIRELAPIIIQVNLDGFLGAARGDTHYRNQFETEWSGGRLDTKLRTKWESDLFAGAYDGTEVTHFDRCKYGVLNIMNDYRGVARCEQYGDSYIILKDVRLRCTFSPRDSANLKADRLAVLDFFAHELLEYTDAELKEIVKVANSGNDAALGNSCVVAPMKYKEAQIHGEVSFTKHVDRLVAADRHNNGYWPILIDEVCKKHGWKFSWVSGEQARLKSEKQQGLSMQAWKERLHGGLHKAA